MKRIIALLLTFAFPLIVYAGIDFKFYGLQWIDYSFEYDGVRQDYSEFSISRTYLRFSAENKETGYKGHVTADINNTSAQTGVDWGIWLKYAYVDLNKIPVISDAGIRIRAGLQKVYFGTVDTWNYPVAVPPFADKNKVVSSADQGISILGNLPDKKAEYEIAAYNGAGYKSEENDFDKALCGSLLIRPIDFLYARGSFYRENEGNASAFVLGLNSEIVEFHIEYVVANKVKTSEGISFAATANVADGMSISVRHDIWNPDTSVDLDEKNLYIVGVNWDILNNVTLQGDYELTQAKIGNGTPNQNRFITRVNWRW